jgi:hypothetical protein
VIVAADGTLVAATIHTHADDAAYVREALAPEAAAPGAWIVGREAGLAVGRCARALRRACAHIKSSSLGGSRDALERRERQILERRAAWASEPSSQRLAARWAWA